MKVAYLAEVSCRGSSLLCSPESTPPTATLHLLSSFLHSSQASPSSSSSAAVPLPSPLLPKTMAVALALLCLLSVIGIAYCSPDNFIVQGRVYCDTCRIGFETPATTYIAGAQVKVECKSRESGFLTYRAEGITDATGTYNIPVANDHQREICEAILVSSPQRGCAVMQAGRERASVVLTHNNGMPSDTRFANSLGFIADRPLALCSELVKQYELDNNEV